MTVKELLEALEGVDPEMEIILQRDPEGNSYSPADGAEPAFYQAQTFVRGEVYTQEDLEEGYGGANPQPIIVLWPKG